jgi:hypothetical protein
MRERREYPAHGQVSVHLRRGGLRSSSPGASRHRLPRGEGWDRLASLGTFSPRSREVLHPGRGGRSSIFDPAVEDSRASGDELP